MSTSLTVTPRHTMTGENFQISQACNLPFSPASGQPIIFIQIPTNHFLITFSQNAVSPAYNAQDASVPDIQENVFMIVHLWIYPTEGIL